MVMAETGMNERLASEFLKQHGSVRKAVEAYKEGK